MKRFQSLGMSLSKAEQKTIVGGVDPDPIGTGTVYGWCTSKRGCWSTSSSLEVCKGSITTNCGSGGGECDTTDRCPW